jgi:hypothetical protein
MILNHNRQTAAVAGREFAAPAFAAEGAMMLTTDTDRARARAEALFKKEEQARESRNAMVEYEAAQRAVSEKTLHLRALRLARDARCAKAARSHAKREPA